MSAHPHTPDGRYFVVRGRLWRLADPALDAETRTALVGELMAARRAVRAARQDAPALTAARARVDVAKRALGERGPPWWSDGAPDFNRKMARTTPYAAWVDALPCDALAPASSKPAARLHPRARAATSRHDPSSA